MIANNTTNVVLYDSKWRLTDSGAINDADNKRDSKTTTANATEYDVQPPKPFVGGHWVYINGEFGYTTAGLASAIDTAKTTATEIRDQLIYGGIDYLGARFKTGVLDVAKIEGVSERYERARPGWATDADWQARHGGYWRTADNQNRAMTLEQFHGLSDAIADQISLIEIEAHRVKDTLLESCTTKAEIDQVLHNFRGFLDD